MIFVSVSEERCLSLDFIQESDDESGRAMNIVLFSHSYSTQTSQLRPPTPFGIELGSLAVRSNVSVSKLCMLLVSF